MADILFLESYYSGSHRYFADGVRQHSKHNVRLLTLPGRFWKWRMEGAALELAKRSEGMASPDLIVTGNLIDLGLWKNLCPWKDTPHILYVHENQLDYPLSPGEKRDFHYVWKDFCNYRLADRILFNSAYNRESFQKGFAAFASRLPDCTPSLEEIVVMKKSVVLPPGCRPVPEDRQSEKFEETGAPPVLLWNHRWEHDKNPEAFFRLLKQLKAKEFPFRLILLGESFAEKPDCFTEARELFKEELIHYGFAPSRDEYESLLGRSDVVLSTSRQENFGIAVVEAMSAGALPLLPDRLAYPEVLPPFLHTHCLYRNDDEMLPQLKKLLRRTDLKELRQRMRDAVEVYYWENVLQRFDGYMSDIQLIRSENL